MDCYSYTSLSPTNSLASALNIYINKVNNSYDKGNRDTTLLAIYKDTTLLAIYKAK